MKVASWTVGVSLFFLIYIVGPYFFIFLNKYFQLPIVKFPFGELLGITMIILGLLFDIYLFFIFKKIGKGSPVVTVGAKKLIVKGPYRFTRNPMYLAHLWIWIGLFFIFGNVSLILYALIGFLGLHVFVTKWEEPKLKEKFGHDYEVYLKNVRRWLII